MAKKLKEFKVVLSYDVQKTFIVDAKNEDEAQEKAIDWEGEISNKDDWEYRELIECEETNA